MPNKKGGKNFKKGKKNRNFDDKKQLIKKDPDEAQEYAQVINAKGNGRFEAFTCYFQQDKRNEKKERRQQFSDIDGKGY